ncbi:MAG: helix-turn-helix domain-containing protein [Acidimicrobiales bacterium]
MDSPQDVEEHHDWIDAESAARRLNVRPNTVYRLVRDGWLPAQRSPVRIRQDDLDAAVERSRVKPASWPI